MNLNFTDIVFKVDNFSFGWASLFVIITAMTVFVVATVFLFIKPAKLPSKLDHIEEIGEHTPLLPSVDPDYHEESLQSIGFDSAVSISKLFEFPYKEVDIFFREVE